MAKKPPPNSTLVERIVHYVETDQEKKAEALCTLADWLEECWAYELTFYPDEVT